MKLNDRSLAMWAASSSPVDKEGYLIKRGEMNKQFQRRWFVLKGNLLFYCAGRNEKEPLGVIILEEHSVAMSENRDTRYAFDITFSAPSARVYTLAADSEEAAMAWMRAIAHASFEYLRIMVQELQRKVDELTESRRDTTLSVSSSTSRDSRRGLASSNRGRHDNAATAAAMAAAASGELLPPSSRRTSVTSLLAPPTQPGGDVARGMTSVLSSTALAVGHTTSTSLLDDETVPDGDDDVSGTPPAPILVPTIASQSSQRCHHHQGFGPSPLGDVRPAPIARSASADVSVTPPRSAAGATQRSVNSPLESRLESPRAGGGGGGGGGGSGGVERSSNCLSAPDGDNGSAGSATPPPRPAARSSRTSSNPSTAAAAAAAGGGGGGGGGDGGDGGLVDVTSGQGLSNEEMLKALSFQSMHKRSFLVESPQLGKESDLSEDLFD